MKMIISGQLLTPIGEPLSGVRIRLTAVNNSAQVFKFTSDEFTTDEAGNYSVDVPVGRYTAEHYDVENRGFRNIGTLTVNADTQLDDLTSLLLVENTSSHRDPLINSIEQLVLTAQTAASQASGAVAGIDATVSTAINKALENHEFPEPVTPSFTVGSVTEGHVPSVSVTGTPDFPVLNFTLKRGEQGPAPDTSIFATKTELSAVPKIVQMTQAQYDALGTKDANTLYIIKATASPTIKLEHFIIYGASIMDSLASSTTDDADFEAKALAKLGYPVSVIDEAVYGWTIANAVADVPSLLTRHDALPKDKRVCVLIHLGGNDVSQNRPYTSAQDSTVVAQMKSGLETIINTIESNGWDWVLSDLTFRDYDNLTYGDVTAEARGALPYIERVHQVINAARHPARIHADGRSWADFYTLLWNNYETWLQTDNVHMTALAEAPFRSWIVDNVIYPVATGVAPTPLIKIEYVAPEPEVPAPSSFLVGDAVVVAFGSAVASDPSTNIPRYPWTDVDGTVISSNLARVADGASTGVSLTVERHFTGPNNAGNSALSVPPYITGAQLAQSWFLGLDPVKGTVRENGALKYSGLPDGTYEVTLAGSRNVTDANREGIITVEVGTGATLTATLDARNPPSGNPAGHVILTLSPVGGVLQLALARPAGSTDTDYAYLGAVTIKRLT